MSLSPQKAHVAVSILGVKGHTTKSLDLFPNPVSLHHSTSLLASVPGTQSLFRCLRICTLSFTYYLDLVASGSS